MGCDNFKSKAILPAICSRKTLVIKIKIKYQTLQNRQSVNNRRRIHTYPDPDPDILIQTIRRLTTSGVERREVTPFTQLSSHKRFTVSNLESQVFTPNNYNMPGLGIKPRSTASQAGVLTTLLPRLSEHTRRDSQRLSSLMRGVNAHSYQTVESLSNFTPFITNTHQRQF